MMFKRWTEDHLVFTLLLSLRDLLCHDCCLRESCCRKSSRLKFAGKTKQAGRARAPKTFVELSVSPTFMRL